MMNTKPKPLSIKDAILQQAMAAYADCIPAGDPQMRQLHWCAEYPVSRLEAVEIMKAATPNGYNTFEPELLMLLPGDAAIYLAREGSVCVYVAGPVGYHPRLRADEHDYDPSTDRTRIWWD